MGSYSIICHPTEVTFPPVRFELHVVYACSVLGLLFHLMYKLYFVLSSCVISASGSTIDLRPVETVLVKTDTAKLVRL